MSVPGSNPNWPTIQVLVDFTLPGSANITLSSPLSTSGSIVALPVNPIPVPLASGSVVWTYANTGGSVGTFQKWTLTAPASLNATSLAVSSQTPNYAYPNGSPVTPWTDITQWCRRIGDGSLMTTSRGRNYERAQTDTGQMTLTLDNSTGVFDPSNSASPYYPNVKPIRKVWLTAAWTTPAGSNMVLNGTFETSVAGWLYSQPVSLSDSLNPTPPEISQSSAQAHSGTKSMAINWGPTTAGSQVAIQTTTIGGLNPGTVYTLSWANRNTNASDLATIQAVDPATSTVLASSAGTANSGAWNVQTATFTAPASGQAYLKIVNQTATAAGNTTYVDDITLTNNTAFTVTYNVFYGTIEEWPRLWKSAGFWGEITATARGVFSSLSNVIMNPLWVGQAIKDGAVSIYRMDEPNGSSYAANFSSYQQPVASVTATTTATTADKFQFGGPSGVGSLSGDPTGSLEFQPQAGQLVGSYHGYYLNHNPVDPSTGSQWFASMSKSWSFECWVQTNLTNANAANWIGTFPLSQIGQDNTAQLIVQISQPAGTARAFFGQLGNGSGPFSNYYDSGAVIVGGAFYPIVEGNWHHIVVTFDPGVGLNIYVDGNVGSPGSSGAPSLTAAPAYQAINSLGNGSSGGGWNNYPQGPWNYKNIATYTSALTSAQVLDHYNAGGGYQNNDTGSVLGKLLSLAPYSLQALDTGNSVLGASATEQRNVVQTLQDCNDTEIGTLIERADGFIEFKNRQSRGGQYPVAVFGEQAFPYEDGITVQQDPKEIYTTVRVTRSEGSTINNVDTSTSLDYYPRTLTINSIDYSDQQAIYLSQYQLNRYKNPHDRIPNLVLNPAANPALWPQVLGREIGDRITVTRNNPGAPPISEDYYIDKISHDVQVGSWKTTWMLSSASLYDACWVLGDANYGVLGSTTILGF